MRHPQQNPMRSQRGAVVRGLLLFLAGALLGANIVYYLLRTQPRDADCGPTAASGQAGRTVEPIASPDRERPTRPTLPAPPAVAVPSPTGSLVIPVSGIRPGQLVDTYTQSRSGGRRHDAIDIMAPAGTPVLAAVDGPVVKLFASDAGGITLYQFDREERYVYYYAHLQGYAPGIVEGRQLRRGDVLGYVGSTGNASPDGPHLHFAIARLDLDKRWHGGTPINPYPLLSGRPAAVPEQAASATPAAATPPTR